MKGYIEVENKKYQEWINNNVPDQCKGDCLKTAKAMKEAFPELTVRGYSAWESSHAWCITPEGTIVDPTAHQFYNGIFHGYHGPQIEHTDFPQGRCPWCGGTIWPDTEGAKLFCELVGEEWEDHTPCFELLMEEEGREE